MKLRDLIRRLKGQRLAFHSSFFLQHFKGTPRLQQVTSAVLDLVESGESQGSASVLILQDILRYGGGRWNVQSFDTCQTLLLNFPNLRFVSVDGGVASAAARMESEFGVTSWHALHLSCARAGGASYFLTADRITAPVVGMESIILSRIEG